MPALKKRVFHTESHSGLQTTSWIWQREVFHNRVLLILLQGSCSEVSAQRHGAGHVSLVSRGSQQRAFSEAGAASLMTCMKVGVRNMWTQILPYHLGSQPVQRPEDAEHEEFQEPIQAHRCGGLTAPSRSSEKPEPGAELHMLIRTAERSAPAGTRAGLRLGLGQIFLPLKKTATVQSCVLLRWLHLADWL